MSASAQPRSFFRHRWGLPYRARPDGFRGHDPALAQASSLVSAAAFGATTAANYALSGLIDWPVVAAMAAGGTAGTLAGLPIARRLGSNVVLGRRLLLP